MRLIDSHGPTVRTSIHDPVLRDKYTSYKSVIVTQTDTLWIASPPLFSSTDGKLSDAVRAAVDVISEIIDERPNLVNIYFLTEIPTNLPPFRKSHPRAFSTRADSIPWIDIGDDIILGRTLYDLHTSPSALQDPYMRPLIYGAFFARFFAAIKPKLLSIKNDMYIAVLHPLLAFVLPVGNGPHPFSGAGRVELINNCLRRVEATKFSETISLEPLHVGDPVMQSVYLFNTLYQRAYGSGRPFRIEYLSFAHQEEDDNKMLSVMLLQYHLHQQMFKKSNETLNDVERTSVFDYMGVTLTIHKQQMTSVEDIFNTIKNENIVATIVSDILINGSDFLPPLVNVTSSVIGIGAVTYTPVQNTVELKVDTPSIFRFLQERILGGLVNPLHYEPNEVEKIMGFYYTYICPIDPKTAEVALVNRNMLLAIISGDVHPTTKHTAYDIINEGNQSDDRLVDVKKAVMEMAFAGDLHPLSLHRRVVLMAWTMAYYVAGHLRSFCRISDANSYAPTRSFVHENVRQYSDSIDPLLCSMLRDIGILLDGSSYIYDECLEINNYPILEYSSVTNNPPRLLISLNMLRRQNVIKTGDSTDWMYVGLNRMVNHIPLFIDTTFAGDLFIEIAASSTSKPIADRLLSLHVLAADKLAQLHIMTQGTKWIEGFLSIFKQNIVEDKYLPDPYLCLLYVWGVNVMSRNTCIPTIDERNNSAHLKSIDMTTTSITIPFVTDRHVYLWPFSLPITTAGWELMECATDVLIRPDDKYLPGGGLKRMEDMTVLTPPADGYLRGLTRTPEQSSRLSTRALWKEYRKNGGKVFNGSMIHINTTDGYILSPIPEVYDYFVPLVKMDASESVWNEWLSDAACVFMLPAFFSWLGAVGLSISRSIIVDTPPVIPPEIIPVKREDKTQVDIPQRTNKPKTESITVPKTPVAPKSKLQVVGIDSAVYNGGKRASTWPFVYCQYKNITVVKMRQHLKVLLDTINEGTEVIRILAMTFPSIRGVEFELTSKHLNIFFVDIAAPMAEKYIEYSMSVIETTLNEDTASRFIKQRAIGNLGASIQLDSGPVPIFFFIVN